MSQYYGLFSELGRRAANLVPAGPKISETHGFVAVSDLRRALKEAKSPVERLTGLRAASEQAAAMRVAVVSRAEWLRWLGAEFQTSFACGFGEEGADLYLYMPLRQQAVLLGLAVGAATSVLGSVDGDGTELLLVVPNVVALEREYDVDAMDVRSWVAMRELTRATLRCSGPWMGEYINTRLASLLAPVIEDLEIEEAAGVPGLEKSAARVDKIARELPEKWAQVADPSPGSLAKRMILRAKLAKAYVVQEIGAAIGYFRAGFEQDETVSQEDKSGADNNYLERDQDAALIALDQMLFLHGTIDAYTDLVMRQVDVREILSARVIAATLEPLHNKRVQGWDKVSRTLLGCDANAYSKGAEFVTHLVQLGGLQAANQLWAQQENLPTVEEVDDPALWLKRMQIQKSHN